MLCSHRFTRTPLMLLTRSALTRVLQTRSITIIPSMPPSPHWRDDCCVSTASAQRHKCPEAMSVCERMNRLSRNTIAAVSMMTLGNAIAIEYILQYMKLTSTAARSVSARIGRYVVTSAKSCSTASEQRSCRRNSMHTAMEV